MIKRFLGFSLLLASLSFFSCSEDEYSKYDADNAKSPYSPIESAYKVKSITTTNRFEGRDYSWEHSFEYDSHNRIKEINVSIVDYRYVDEIDHYYTRNIKSKAQYYYFDNALDVRYSISWEHPENPLLNSDASGIVDGLFSADGNIIKMASMDFEYSGNTLADGYSDGGRHYVITHDRNGNVTGYTLYSDNNSVITNKADAYKYSLHENKTNFDFSGYFGYWGVETEMPYNGTPYYAPYQFAAFGMLGSTSPQLPLGRRATTGIGDVVYGEWKLDNNGCPVEFVDTDGRKTVITYF